MIGTLKREVRCPALWCCAQENIRNNVSRLLHAHPSLVNIKVRRRQLGLVLCCLIYKINRNQYAAMGNGEGGV